MSSSSQTCLLLVLAVIATQYSIDGARLNDYILDYQPLHFDRLHLHEKHSRVRRSVDPYFRWIFKAYNRTFNIHLQPSSSIFAENHELIFGDEPPKKVDTSFIYEGILAGEPSSSVHMSIIDGNISGHIIVPGHTTYHIEPARNHFNHSDFHTIIYPESHMNLDPYRHKRSASGICGDREVYEKLSKMWRPVEELSFRHVRERSSENSYHNKYSAEANAAKTRQRRQLANDKKTCYMSLRADGLLYNHFFSKSKSQEKAKEELLSLFASHVKALNDIYLMTVFNTFDNTISFRGVGFQLQRSTVITECGPDTWPTGYCTDNLDVSNFLDLTANENHDTFCLVHTFTYRDFVGGTLGLAWVATPDSRNSGVCGKYGAVRDDKNGISDRSLNTGIVTLINFNQEVPTRVSQLTFAHEVGHNFGAQHDAKAECAPYGTSQPDSSSGNYIMFPSATQGNLPNNGKFSSCSKNDIAKVLDTLAPKGKRNNCFQTSNNAFCGNGVVELNEKCDCGYKEDCKDKCCNYQTDPQTNSSCTLTSGSLCSPTEGQCCSSNCTYEISGTLCLPATDCNAESYCVGNSAKCPPPQHKENKTFCNNYNKLCESGECIGSVCSRIDWIECFLTVAQGASNEQMCYISCKESETSECISSYDSAKVNANPKFKDLLTQIHEGQKSTLQSLGLRRPSGSPCNDYKGYCDVFSKCKNVDAEGPFKQLTDLIFNPVTLKNIRTWIEDHWWGVLLMCIGVVVFMGVFIKIFGYNTPSKNPKKKEQGPLAGRSVPAGPRQASRPAAQKPKHEQKQHVYATDLPMYARPTSDRGQHIYDRPDYNDGRYGYDNQAFQGPSHNRGHQQYDRIARSRNY